MEKDKKIVQNDKNDVIKVLFLGESGVGKTNIINILMGEIFNDNEITTISSHFSEKKIFLENKEYKLHLWQIPSQEKYRTLARLFYNNSKIFIFVYDITIKSSFDELKYYWIQDVEDKIGPDFVKGIIANKTDIFYDKKESIDDDKKLAKLKNAKFLEFSAKDEGPEKLERFLSELLKEYLQKENKAKNKNEIKNEFYYSDYDLNNLNNLNKFLSLYKWLDK